MSKKINYMDLGAVDKKKRKLPADSPLNSLLKPDIVDYDEDSTGVEKVKEINDKLRWKYLNKSIYLKPYAPLDEIDAMFDTVLVKDKVIYGKFMPEDFGINSEFYLKEPKKAFDSMLKDTAYGIDHGYFLGKDKEQVLNKDENEYIQVKITVPSGYSLVKAGSIEDLYYVLPRESTLKYIEKTFNEDSKVINITAELVARDELTKLTSDRQKALNAELKKVYQVQNDLIKLTPIGLNAGFTLNLSSRVILKAFESLKNGNVYSKDLYNKVQIENVNGTQIHTDFFELKYKDLTFEQRSAQFNKDYKIDVNGLTTSDKSQNEFYIFINFNNYTADDSLPQVAIEEIITGTTLHEILHYLTYLTEDFTTFPVYKGLSTHQFKLDVEKVMKEEKDALVKLLNDDYAETDWEEYSCEAFMAKLYPVTDISSQFKQVAPKTNRLLDKLFDVTPPSTPKNLKALDVGGNFVKLTFDNASDNIGVDKYNIYMDGKVLKTVDTIKDSNGLSYPTPEDEIEIEVTNLKQVTEYNFQITAVDDSRNESDKSGVLKVTTKDVEAPQLTGQFSCTAIRSRIVQCFWSHPTDNHDVAEVIIYRNESSALKLSNSVGNNEKVFSTSGDAIYYTDTTIEKGKTYTYYMVAKDSAGNVSKKSNSVTIRTTDEDDQNQNEDMAKDTTYTSTTLDWGDIFSDNDPAPSGFGFFDWISDGLDWVANGFSSLVGNLTSTTFNLVGGVINLIYVVPLDSNGNPMGKGILISVPSIDRSSIKVKDSTLYVGQTWNPAANLVSATDENNKKIEYNDSRITHEGTVDTSKPGIYEIKYSYKGIAKTSTASFEVTVKEDKSSIKSKDSTLYVGQTWDPTDNLVSAIDEDGNKIDYNDPRIVHEGNVNTSKPGVYEIKYSYKGIAKTSTVSFKVTVKEDKSSIETKDCTIYVGRKLMLADNIVTLTDEDGNRIDINSPVIDYYISRVGDVDTDKPGVYSVEYKYRGKLRTISSACKITVKEAKKITFKTKNTTLFVGEAWDPSDNFVSATDEDGNNIGYNDSRITYKSDVDTSKPGVYDIQYIYSNKMSSITYFFYATITVKNKSSIYAKDSLLYTSQTWDPADNFVSATDENGNKMDYGDPRITHEGNVDMSKPGSYKIKYTYKGVLETSSSTCTVTVRENKSSLKTRDSTLFIGDTWDSVDNFVFATDRDGNEVNYKKGHYDSRISYEGDVDTSKPGVYTIKYKLKEAIKNIFSTCKVTVEKVKISIQTEDSTLYVGQTWNPVDNFVSATDENGNKMDYNDSRITHEGDVDTSKPGIYEIKYSCKGIQKTIISTCKVIVKEDESSIQTKNSTLYMGQAWVKADNLVLATDEDGNKVDYDDTRIIRDGMVDTTKLGIYTIKYSYKGVMKTISSSFTVTVKEDESSIETKNSTLYVGQTWVRADNLVLAIDEDGNKVDYNDVRIICDGMVDTSKTGVYEIKYSYKGIMKTTSSSFTVIVKEDKSFIQTRSSVLYIGQTWNPADNLVLATDEDGNRIEYGDPRITRDYDVDTSKVGYKYIKYAYNGVAKKSYSGFIVTVEKDKSSIKTKDSVLYVGQDWNPVDNLVSVIDERGLNVSYNDSRVTYEGNVDTGKPGIYNVKYSYKGLGKTSIDSFKVTVKEDKSSIRTKDSVLYVGQKWERADNLVLATDEDGNKVDYDDTRIIRDGMVDTTKPGIYTIKYSYKGLGKTSVDSFKVTVKEDKSSIKTKNSKIFIGKAWNPADNFVSATDEEGNKVDYTDSRITHQDIDTSHAIAYFKVEFSYKGLVKTSYSYCKIIVEDLCSVKTKNTTLYVGETWNPADNFVSATDEYGNNVEYNDSRISYDGKVDTTTDWPGLYIIKYSYKGPFGTTYSNCTVTVRKDRSSIQTKNSTLYVGQKWERADNLVLATDEDGNEVDYNDVRIIRDGMVDTSKTGVYEIKYSYKGIMKTTSSSFTVTVKEDKSSIQTRDSTLYVGQKWERADNLVLATDEDGNKVDYDDTRIIRDGMVDTTKPGIYTIKYSYKGIVKTISSSFKVNVEDKSSIQTKDSTLYVGQKWERADNLVLAIDEEGNKVDYNDARIIRDGMVDTTKPGIYTIKYSYKGISKTISASFKVTVKEDKSSIETKNITIYVGQKWKPEYNFVSATDEDGNKVELNDPRISHPVTVDTSFAEDYALRFSYTGLVKEIVSWPELHIR